MKKTIIKIEEIKEMNGDVKIIIFQQGKNCLIISEEELLRGIEIDFTNLKPTDKSIKYSKIKNCLNKFIIKKVIKDFLNSLPHKKDEKERVKNLIMGAMIYVGIGEFFILVILFVFSFAMKLWILGIFSLVLIFIMGLLLKKGIMIQRKKEVE